MRISTFWGSYFLNDLLLAMVNLRAPRLWAITTIPSNVYLPEATTISFAVDVPDLSVCMCLPKWNTQFLYNQGKEHHVLQAGKFRIDGTFHYWAEVHPDNIEQLKVAVSVRRLSLAFFHVHVQE